jgi:hypothetical protein
MVKMDNCILLHITLLNSLINYEIHDKELLAIIDAFEEWHHLLERLNIQLRFTRITRILNIS